MNLFWVGFILFCIAYAIWDVKRRKGKKREENIKKEIQGFLLEAIISIVGGILMIVWFVYQFNKELG